MVLSSKHPKPSGKKSVASGGLSSKATAKTAVGPSSVGTKARVQRHRDAMRASGMKLVQFWVPDTKAPGFAEEVVRQAALIKANPDRELDEIWSELIDDALEDLE